jgi:methyl-accepting chemotaxis protein
MTMQSQLGAIAARLIDIAASVVAESEAATSAVRGMTDQTRRVELLAATLDKAADQVEADVLREAETLDKAQAALSANRPAIDALTRSIQGVASITTTMSEIARESEILSLNARIEAARAGAGAGAFSVVAREMSALTERTMLSTRAVEDHASAIMRDMGAANAIVSAHAVLLDEQAGLLAATRDAAERQRDTARELASITPLAVGTVEATAAAIGRVSSNATAVKMLARQVLRLAGTLQSSPAPESQPATGSLTVPSASRSSGP